MVGYGVVTARVILALVEGAGVAMVGVEGASVLGNDVVGNQWSRSRGCCSRC